MLAVSSHVGKNHTGKYTSLPISAYESLFELIISRFATIAHGGGGSSIVKVPGDVPPARVYFFGLLV